VVEDEKFSLVWRRQFPQRYDVDAGNEATSVVDKAPDRISRRPLAPSEITALIDVAIGLHKSAIKHEQAKRWWIPLATAAAGFASALLAVYLTSLLANVPSGDDPAATPSTSISPESG
jgi:hypothetical protein